MTLADPFELWARKRDVRRRRKEKTCICACDPDKTGSAKVETYMLCIALIG